MNKEGQAPGNAENMLRTKISVIGAGKMGEALIADFLASRRVSEEDLLSCEKIESRRGYMVLAQ